MPKWVQKTKRDLIGHVTCGRGMNNTQKADKGSPLPLDLSFWYTQIATWQMHLTSNINILTVRVPSRMKLGLLSHQAIPKIGGYNACLSQLFADGPYLESHRIG
ncbi:hypothetical protein Peur_005667 [Populus x canadensis]